MPSQICDGCGQRSSILHPVAYRFLCTACINKTKSSIGWLDYVNNPWAHPNPFTGGSYRSGIPSYVNKPAPLEHKYTRTASGQRMILAFEVAAEVMGNFSNPITNPLHAFIAMEPDRHVYRVFLPLESDIDPFVIRPLEKVHQFDTFDFDESFFIVPGAISAWPNRPIASTFNICDAQTSFLLQLMLDGALISAEPLECEILRRRCMLHIYMKPEGA